jgi:hypothetical protein
MQCILGIDLSTQPCELTLSQIEGSQIEVLSRTTVRLPFFADKQALRSAEVLSALSAKPAAASVAVGQEATPDGPAEQDGDASEQLRELVRQTVLDLRDAIRSFEPVWTASAVILPQDDFLSLNLDLPFGDAKNLDRIVDLEVQDVVPFELESFFVQYSSLGSAETPAAPSTPTTDGKQYDVHIGILPRVVVQNSLEICKKAGIEPNVLTVPSSAIAAAYNLARDYFVGNSAVIYNRGDEYCISIFINGEVRVERAVYASQILSALPSGKREESLQQIFTALKLIMASAERRYNARIEKVYLLGREVKASNAGQLFGRPLEGLAFKDLFSAGEVSTGISPLTAVFAKDEAATVPLSNFRSREFSFTPRISEFLRALAGTRRHAVRALGAVAVAALVVYLSREYMLRSSEAALVEQVKRVIPGFSAGTGSVREGLMKAESKLAEELGAFGSRSKFSPADSFIEILKSIPQSGEIAVNSIRVSGVRLQLTGSGGDLSAIERFKKTLEGKQDVFSKVDLKTSPAGGRFNFSFDVGMVQ